MREKIKNFLVVVKDVPKGGPAFYAWIGFLMVIIAMGVYAYSLQMRNGFIVTSIRDHVSWGFYISNFTFLVGVAAAAVLLIVPAYLYHFQPIKEIVFMGETMAISAITMCIMFVTADLGHPERLWHLLPGLGRPNFPSSLLTWDIIVLNSYLIVNATVFFYILYKIYEGKDYHKIMPLIILSIPLAVSIHTVTAFLYNGLVARPFWNASILAPRFLASAFCSGPALMILVVQIVRRVTKVDINDEAIFKIAELIAYTIAINIFLLGCEVYKEFYSGSIHLAPLEYMYFGLHGHNALVPWMWLSFALNITAFVIFVVPKFRGNIGILNIGCILVFVGVYIEKGVGLVLPGFIPETLGDIYEYAPSKVEVMVALGIWAVGALVYTILLKFALPVYKGNLRLNTQSE